MWELLPKKKRFIIPINKLEKQKDKKKYGDKQLIKNLKTNIKKYLI